MKMIRCIKFMLRMTLSPNYGGESELKISSSSHPHSARTRHSASGPASIACTPPASAVFHNSHKTQIN